MCESEAHAKEPRGRAPSGSPRGHKGSSGCPDREPLFSSVDYRPMVLAVLPLFCRANGASDKLRDQNQKEAPQFRGRFGGWHLVLRHSKSGRNYLPIPTNQRHVKTHISAEPEFPFPNKATQCREAFQKRAFRPAAKIHRTGIEMQD